MLAAVALPTAVNAQAVPKVGTFRQATTPAEQHACQTRPSGPRAQPFPKLGSCPSGYHTSGDYCLGTETAKHAIPKTGACPSGYHTSGAYCLSNR
jgi:hypothetical protein